MYDGRNGCFSDFEKSLLVNICIYFIWRSSAGAPNRKPVYVTSARKGIEKKAKYSHTHTDREKHIASFNSLCSVRIKKRILFTFIRSLFVFTARTQYKRYRTEITLITFSCLINKIYIYIRSLLERSSQRSQQPIQSKNLQCCQSCGENVRNESVQRNNEHEQFATHLVLCCVVWCF